MEIRPRFDSQDETILRRFTDELTEIYGGVLIAVAVTGEAASSCYRAGRTPLETVIVVEEVTPAVLRAARGSIRRWARRRIPTPLFVDPIFLEGGLDTFALEFMELRDRHVVLHGDPEIFDSIRIDRTHLRLQVEEQLRGKMLHLWEAYLESGSRRRDLTRLLLEPLVGFDLALRGLLRLRKTEERGVSSLAPEGVGLIDAVASELGLALPTFRRLVAIRLDDGRIEGDMDEVFAAFLAELRSIVRAIDRLAEWDESHAG